MLITFKSSAYANITMFGDVGRKMLEMMDFGDSVPGAIKAEDVPAARDNLKRALAQIPEQAEPAYDPDDGQPVVTLHMRAVPLVKMLEAAAAEDTYVSWE